MQCNLIILIRYSFFRLKVWLDLIEQSYWLDERTEEYVHNNGRLCSKHFSDDAFSSTLRNKLIRFALPVDLRNNSIENADSSAVNNLLTISLSSATPSIHNTSNLNASITSSSNLESSSVCNAPDLHAVRLSTKENTPKTKEILRLRCVNSKMKKRLFKLENSPKLSFHEWLQNSLTKRQYEFVCSQIKAGKTHRNGRRWTAKEKASALSIFLQSSGTYKTLRLSCGLALPCVNTLMNSTGNIAKDDGFCPILYKAIQNKVKTMQEDEKLCTLVFDEMAIKAQLTYNAFLDKVDGFESAGTGKVSTQALVFMLRGITKNWKQVII